MKDEWDGESGSDGWSGLLLIGVICLAVYGCQPKLEDRDDYKAGYKAGYSVGTSEEHDLMCERIEEILNEGARNAVCD